MGSGYIYSNSNLNTLFSAPINVNVSENQMTPYNLTNNPTQVPFIFLNGDDEMFCEVQFNTGKDADIHLMSFSIKDGAIQSPKTIYKNSDLFDITHMQIIHTGTEDQKVAYQTTDTGFLKVLKLSTENESYTLPGSQNSSEVKLWQEDHTFDVPVLASSSAQALF